MSSGAAARCSPLGPHMSMFDRTSGDRTDFLGRERFTHIVKGAGFESFLPLSVANHESGHEHDRVVGQSPRN